MALDKSTKLAIQAKLRLGISPKDIAEQLEVKINAVYTINQKLSITKDDEMIQELHELPIETVAHIVTEAKKIAPTPVTEAFDAVVAGADGLKKLDMSFQATMTNVLSRFDEMLQDKELALKDIVLISNTTANAYEKVFTAGTNIHIGDNNSHSSQKLTVFQNKKGV